MPYTRLEDETRIYYELTGPEDGPVVIQFGGGLFGRHNFGAVNDGFREAGFRLLAFDARGYGASDHPHEEFTIEGWARDGAALLDAVGIDRVLVHGTSMGGMIAIAFTALYPERAIAACADVAFAKPDVYRRTLFRVWRRMAETMPWDDFSDHVTTQAVGAKFLESEEGKDTFELVRAVIGWNDPYTVRQACLAMENMDLTGARAADRAAAPDDERDVRHPLPARAGAVGPRRATDGGDEPEHHDARVPGHRPRRPARVPCRSCRARDGLLQGGIAHVVEEPPSATTEMLGEASRLRSADRPDVVFANHGQRAESCLWIRSADGLPRSPVPTVDHLA